jgi:hypothetical protein
MGRLTDGRWVAEVVVRGAAAAWIKAVVPRPYLRAAVPGPKPSGHHNHGHSIVL